MSPVSLTVLPIRQIPFPNLPAAVGAAAAAVVVPALVPVRAAPAPARVAGGDRYSVFSGQ